MREIGDVARELGVKQGTLRDWERDYGVVVANRDARGRRVYDDRQISDLRRILGYVDEGERAHLERLQKPASKPLQCARLVLPPTPDAPARARRAVSELLGSCGSQAFAVQLVASELVKNAVVYGSRTDQIRVDLEVHADWFELRVSNAGAPLHMKRLRRRRHAGGRGLEIMDALVWGWSIDTGPLGTTISARIPLVEPLDDRFPAPRNGYRTSMPDEGVDGGLYPVAR